MGTKTIKTDRKALIIGESIDEIIDFALPLIRPQSKDCYKREIRADLLKQNYSWIDIHAGMKITYDILLLPEPYIQSKFEKFKQLHYNDLASLKTSLESAIIKYENSRASEMTKTMFRVTTYRMIIDRITRGS